MKATSSSKAGGFTLLEAMIALAIISIALVTLLGLGNRSIGVNARLQKITQATLLAQEKMTEIEFEAELGRLDFLEKEDGFEAPFDGYRWRTRYEGTPLTDVKMVTVTVLWGEEKKNEAVDLNSFLLSGPPGS
ncbi:MAG: hypothetical protein C0617_04425 [Desulfuromonas sp.]|uniref:type IV pilus modification PilV family protein n=1 Tax=Desulfuromonas sp. TaxID=892 RepID=UPI000CC06C4F|nr:prepilin-type N-terminal cleavage/methylation domain-containing protein [Desulfuromonas sp.]PLX85323.1 MAG: hypothetical protein C0617_04425 [Desulfuromonas sp.]